MQPWLHKCLAKIYSYSLPTTYVILCKIVYIVLKLVLIFVVCLTLITKKMAVRKSIARTSVSDKVTVTVSDKEFTLYYSRTLWHNIVGDQISKSKLYYIAKKLAKQAIEKNIEKTDGTFSFRMFDVICVNGQWYQLQSENTPAENLLLPNFRLTEIYKSLKNN